MNYSSDELNQDLDYLFEKGLISVSEKNLRSKIDNIIRSIENLQQKEIRIKREIETQKRSLTRKRIELKKNSKSLKKKTTSVSESLEIQTPYGRNREAYDNCLLRESNRILED